MESETCHISSIDSTISECGVIYCMEAFDLSPYIALEERETTLIKRSRDNTLTHSQSMDEDLFKSIPTSSITTEVDLRHQQEEKLTVPFSWNTLWDESTSVQEDNSSLLDSNPRYESRSRAYAFIDYSASHILPGLDLSYTHNQISVTEVSNPRYESRSRAYAFINYSASHILPGLDLSYTHNQISVTEVVPRKNRNVLNWLKCRLFKM